MIATGARIHVRVCVSAYRIFSIPIERVLFAITAVAIEETFNKNFVIFHSFELKNNAKEPTHAYIAKIH